MIEDLNKAMMDFGFLTDNTETNNKIRSLMNNIVEKLDKFQSVTIEVEELSDLCEDLALEMEKAFL